MTKLAFIFLTILLSTDLYSQISKGNILLSIDGNYSKKNSESGVTTNATYTQGKYLDLGFTLGHFVSDKFVIGAGLEYLWNNETRFNSFQNVNQFMQIESMSIKSHVYLPNLFCGYYFPLTKGLYLSSNVKLLYGKLKTESSSTIANMEISNTEGSVTIDPSIYRLLVRDYDHSNDYCSARIYPELTYFVSKKLCLNLGMGGIEYAMVDWSFESSTVDVSFNPNHWKLGLKFYLN